MSLGDVALLTVSSLIIKVGIANIVRAKSDSFFTLFAAYFCMVVNSY